MEETRFAKLVELANDIEQYRFDYTDAEGGFYDQLAIKQLAKRFVSAARGIRNKEFQDAVTRIDPEAPIYDLYADLQCLVDRLREIAENPEALEWTGATEVFVEPSVIGHLRQCPARRFDLSKVVRYCEELNSSYALGNYLASTLLIRSLLNHVPPLFGHATFQQVVSQSSRSIKELLRPLEEVSRDVADHHTHSTIRHKESLPTKSQVEPFKANLEVLLHEVIAKAQEPVKLPGDSGDTVK
jgi:hypothetical protein